MNIEESYRGVVEAVQKNIANNIKNSASVIDGKNLSHQNADSCPDNLRGEFMVTGRNGYSHSEQHLAAAIVRVESDWDARAVWHVEDDKKLVLSIGGLSQI